MKDHEVPWLNSFFLYYNIVQDVNFTNIWSPGDQFKLHHIETHSQRHHAKLQVNNHLITTRVHEMLQEKSKP